MTTEKAPTLKTFDFNIRQVKLQPWYFAVHTFFTLIVFGIEVLPGYIQKLVFDQLSGQSQVRYDLWLLIAFFVAVSVGRLLSGVVADWYGWTFRFAVGALLRRNLFASILRRPGDKPLPVSPGEAINRFSTDVEEVADFPTWLPDQLGKWIAGVIAIAIMASINLQITLIIFVPMIAIMVIYRLAWGRFIYYSRKVGSTTDAVTGFLGEIFESVQAVKVAGGESGSTEHFNSLNKARAQAEVKENFFWNLIFTINDSMITFGIGVILLMAGQMITAGTFTVGDFALFVSYLWFTTSLPMDLGAFVGDYKTQEVSIDRILDMIRPETPEALVENHPIYEREAVPPVVYPQKSPSDRLDRLEVLGLTYRHPERSGNGSGRENGIWDINFSVQRGTFTVITGRVGSAKSTLVRVLLGLLPVQSGEIRWNGKLIVNPSAFFRPPRCAYTSQVPRLFSETLRNNILMGLPDRAEDLNQAIHLAVFEKDLAELNDGLDTLVGPRGIRLSGGQVQRAAAARMFVREPELLVFDDLSSALDVETERILWERLDQRKDLTCLVVSHRKTALRRADHIILLKNGRIEDEGRLEELLERSEEMRLIWRGGSDE